MANYNKSFNFRNGVQVDNDNFVVNPNGLVGIGTTIPTDFLDVYGTSKFNSPIKGTDITLSGLTSTRVLNVGIVSIASGIVTAISGIITYYGDGGKLINLPTSQWIDVDSGFGYTSIYSAGNVGIATTIPTYTFQVGSNPNTASGVGFNSTGNIKASGIITAYSFSGFGTDIQGINASNISNGTLNNSRLPSNINLTGIITANSFSGFGTNIQGIDATNITNGTLSNSRLPQSINVSGIITTSTNFSGNLIGNVNSTGISTFSGGISVSNVNSTGISTFSGGISVSNVNSTGLSTFSGGIVGNVTGIASTARDLISTANISINSITSGLSTVSTRLYAESIGVGTNSPSSDIHIRRTSSSTLQLTSNSAEASIAIGRSTTLTGSNGSLRFGNTSGLYPYSTTKSLDIINYDIGNINNYLNPLSVSGVGTGNFNWFYNLNPIMSLTYDGKLGVGVTLPTNTLHVGGSSTVTSNSYVGNDLSVGNNLTVSNNLTINGTFTSTGTISANLSGNVTGNLTGNVNSTGLSTFSQAKIITRLGIGETASTYQLEVGSGNSKVVIGNSAIGINTTKIIDGIGLDASQSIALLRGVGVGVTNPISFVDFSDAGKGFLSDVGRFMLPPKINNTQRNALNVVEGGLIYNTTSRRLELFNGSGWVGIATIA